MSSLPERRMDWDWDMHKHPDSPIMVPYLETQQNADHIICPYCGHKEEPERYDDYDTYCAECEKEYTVEADFGYGFSCKPEPCKHGHRYVFTSQYEYKGKWVRIMNCTECAHQLYFGVDINTIKPLPWLDEYNDPDYFDPDGVLDVSVEPKETPVLDALRRRNFNPIVMARALEKHDELYS